MQNPTIPAKYYYHQLRDKGLLTHSHSSFFKVSVRLDWALELMATKSQPPLLPSQPRHSRAGRASETRPPNAPVLCLQGLIILIPSICANSNKKQWAQHRWGKWAPPHAPMEKEWHWPGSPSLSERHRAGTADCCRCRKDTELESPRRFPMFLPKSQYFNWYFLWEFNRCNINPMDCAESHKILTFILEGWGG